MVRISVCLRFAPSGSPTLRFPLSPLSTFPGTHPLPFFRKDVIPKDLSGRVCKSCDSKGVTEKARQSRPRSSLPFLIAARAAKFVLPALLALSEVEGSSVEGSRADGPPFPYLVISLLPSLSPVERELHAL